MCTFDWLRGGLGERLQIPRVAQVHFEVAAEDFEEVETSEPSLIVRFNINKEIKRQEERSTAIGDLLKGKASSRNSWDYSIPDKKFKLKKNIF